MEDDFSKKALLQFVEIAIDKGLANPNTANGWRAACKRILADVGEGDDVRSLDVPTHVKRFNNRYPGDLSPSSLKEYERRLQRLVKEFVSYVKDPTGYKGHGRGASTSSGERARKASRTNAGTSAESSAPEAANAGVRPVTPGISLEFPMRPDFLAQVVVPRDIKLHEAKRFSRFIMTLAHDYKPDESDG